MNNIHGYFKIGDIVKNESVWGDILFVIHGLHGNSYQALLSVHFRSKPINIKNTCNFKVTDTKLVNSYQRPFKNLSKDILLKVLAKGNIEAKRELIIRSRKN